MTTMTTATNTTLSTTDRIGGRPRVPKEIEEEAQRAKRVTNTPQLRTFVLEYLLYRMAGNGSEGGLRLATTTTSAGLVTCLVARIKGDAEGKELQARRENYSGDYPQLEDSLASLVADQAWLLCLKGLLRPAVPTGPGITAPVVAYSVTEFGRRWLRTASEADKIALLQEVAA